MIDERTKLQRILDDRMAPRRWAVTGASLMVVGAVAYLLDPQREGSWTSFLVGLLFAAVALAVDAVLRLRIRALDRRAGGRTAPPSA